MEKLILIGAGGYAKSVLDSLDEDKYTLVGFIDERIDKTEHLGYPVLANNLDGIKDAENYVYFVSIGNNEKRKKWFDEILSRNLKVISVIDKHAIVSRYATIGQGCFIGKLAIVNSCAVISDDCIVNTKALMEHGTFLGKHVNLSTNSVINGDVAVGDGTFVGSCSVVIGQIKIGSWAMIGAGAVVIRDVADSVTVAGVPAKVIK